MPRVDVHLAGGRDGGWRNERPEGRLGAATSVATDPLERLRLAARPAYVRRAILVLLAGDIALILAHCISGLFGHDGWLNLERERSIGTWYSSTQLFMIAALFALMALMVGARDRMEALVLLMPVALFGFLSMDETLGVHERAGILIDSKLIGASNRDEMVFRYTGYWMLVLGPLLGAAMVAIGIAYHRLVRPARSIVRLAVLGTTVFLLGAVGMEVVRNFVEGRLVLTLQVAFEEGMELIGVTLIAAAALHLVAGRPRQYAPAAPGGGTRP